MKALGLDIGGANLKAAMSDGSARSRPFPLWKKPNQLAAQLRELVAEWTWDRAAVTMTGELCDCFETKRNGVRAILNAVVEALGDARIWRNDRRFVAVQAALGDPLPCAAANWLALATYAAQLCHDQDAILLDVGSTTTDVIPLRRGRPIPRGRTDTERLNTGELVYIGIRRTPVCMLLGVDGMGEFFATTHDVGLILRDIAECESDCDTADQQSATREFALARLARMVGGDRESMSESAIIELAQDVRRRQIAGIRAGYDRVCKDVRPDCILLSGAGEDIGRQVATGCHTVISLREKLGASLSEAACAYALTQLLHHQDHQ